MRSPLAFRLAVDRVRRAPALVILAVVAIAVATCLIVALSATSNAITVRGERTAQRELPLHEGEENLADATLVGFTTAEFNGISVTIMEIAPTSPNSPTPEGVKRMPKPGEVLASPRFLELIAQLPDGSALSPAGRFEVLADAALVEPNEYVAIRGWDPDVLAQRVNVAEVATFPMPSSPNAWWNSKVAVALGVWLIALAVLLPALMLVGVAARLSLYARRRYVAALRIVGASSTQVGAIVATEMAIVGIAGTVLGYMGFLAMRPIIAKVEIGGVAWFPTDFQPSLASLVILFIGVPSLAALSSLVAVRAAIKSPLQTAERSIAKPVRARTASALVGIAGVSFVGVISLGPDSPMWVPFTILGIAGLLLALPLLGPTALSLFGKAMSRRTANPAMLIAARSTVWDATAAFRPAVGIMVAVFLATLINGYGTGNLQKVGVDSYDGDADVVITYPAGDAASVNEFMDAASGSPGLVTAMAMRRVIDEQSEISVTIGSCDSAKSLQLIEVEHCDSNDGFASQDMDRASVGSIGIGAHGVVVEGQLLGTFEETAKACCLGTDLLLSESLVGEQVTDSTEARRILLKTSSVDAQALMASAGMRYLAGSSLVTSEVWAESVNQPVVEAKRIVNAILILSFILASLSLTASSIGRVIDRAGVYARLRAAGTPFVVLRRSINIEVCATLLIALLLGSATGIVTASTLVRVLGGTFSPSVGLVIVTMAAAVCVAGVATSAATKLLRAMSDPRVATVV